MPSRRLWKRSAHRPGRVRPGRPSRLRPGAFPGPVAALLLAVPLAVASAPAAAEDIAFVEASSERDDGRPATNMYNAVDGKDTTAWCTKGDDREPVLSFGFDQPVTVTHIGLVVGAVKGGNLDRSTRRARVVTVGDVEHRVEAKFRDEAALQVLELSPPAKGRRIVVEFPGVYDGQGDDAPLCIAEVVLKTGGRELTGNQIATKLRALNTPSKRLLHEWLDDVSAPQRTLLFNVDGTFTYRYEPLLEGKPARLRGKWTAVDRAITLEWGGKSFRLKSRLTKIDEGDGSTVELVVAGEPPHPSMAATYRPAPSRLP